MTSLSGWILNIYLLHQIASSQWTSMTNSLYYKQIYIPIYYQVENWYNQQNLTPSPFITCTLEAQSIIYLNGADSTKTKAYYQLSFASYQQAKAFLTLDLYFTGTWSSGTVSLYLGSWSTTITYTNPTTMPFTGGFCDALAFDIQSYSFVLPPNLSGSFTITIVAPAGQVGFRNFHTSYQKCHYSCRTCSGPNDNECLTCFSGIVDNLGKCQSCPSATPYLDLYQGCRNYCDQSYIKDSNNVCQSYSEGQWGYDYFSSSSISTIQYYDRTWSQVYDPEHVDGGSKENICLNYFFGPYTTRAGAFKSVSLPSGRSFPVRIKMELTILGQFQENSGIQLKLNNQYVGSLTYFNSQYNLDNAIVTQNISRNTACLSYTNYFDLTLLFTIPTAPSGNVFFKIIGNLSQPTLEAWGIRSAYILVGQCLSYCSVCDETSYCITCQSSSYTLYQGKCYPYYNCPSSVGFVNSSNYCEAYESQLYSKSVFQGFYDFMPFEGMDSVFTLLNQTGTNFKKGPNNYTSYTYSKRIFGGPYIWAQAAFQKIFSLPDPHYAASVHFTIIFGSSFTLGNFSYQIEQNPVVTLGKSNCTTSNLIGDVNMEYLYKVHELLSTHNTNTLDIIVHCFGNTNSVQYAYCGIQDLFIVEHQCQPYCLACTSPTVCTSWNSTYDSSIIKFDGSSCLIDQYYNRLQYQCFDCHPLCPTCRTFEQCTSCISTFTLFNYQCLCTITQYLDPTNPPQCLNCQQPCLTCSSLTYCTDCDSSQTRVLENGVCKCATNYYEEAGNFFCQPCNQYCTACNGPDNGQCTACITLTNFILDAGTCRCSDNFYYSQVTQVCETCHYSCLTCYENQLNNCLSCSLANHRALVGLNCPCQLGFYEATSVSLCSACPALLNPALLDCYKLCGDASSVWHNAVCPTVTCGSGYQNQSNQCTPICGDSQVVAGEDCDDGNAIQFDGCHNCGFQCSPYCLTCDSTTIFPCIDICGDGIVSGTEECDDGNVIPYDGCYNCLYQCQSQCTNCIKGLCYECSTYGWKVNTIDLTCIENCGDSLVVNREQCDDNNTNPEDGCDNCRFLCRSDCLECNSTGNICLKCLPGFRPQSYYCNNICGDGKIVSSAFYTEQCDDFNNINQDGCSYSCQFQCQAATICLLCDAQQKCQQCAPEYRLNQQKNKCEEICGDSQIVGAENCEDLNNRMYDGCYKCRYQCQIECAICSSGVCLQCKAGYFLDKFNNHCSPICGDRLIVTPEQCDDGNLVFDDGCHNCQFNCQDSCLHCIYGKCYTCKDGYYLNSISQCKPICGDNLTVPNEECDYQHLALLENCHNCKLTCSLYCQQCFYGLCSECQPQYELDPVSSKCFPSILSQQENCISTIQNECIECADGWSLNQISNECMSIVEQTQTCQINCKICDLGKCMSCELGYLYDDFSNSCIDVCGDGVVTGNEECDSNDENCINCQLVCEEQCANCIQGECLQCQVGWIFDNIREMCLEIQGDTLLVGSEICDVDQSQFMNQWLINFDFQDKCMECEQNCQTCNNGLCTSCQVGYYVSNLNSRCESKCGDQIKTIDEQCDSSSDYCQQCLLICKNGCQQCNDTTCLLCHYGFQLDIAGQCIPICGDGVLVGNELMDNVNTNNCYQCPTNCQICFNNHCQECEYGYYLNAYDFSCESTCGDSIVSGNEQCDQGFDNIYCVQCKIQCQMSCLQCNEGKCLQCSDGWTLNQQNNKCYETKNDGTEVGLEICDSGQHPLQITNDSCYQCDDDCFSCLNHKCQQCKPGYYLDLFSNECNSMCGDNIQVGSVECDSQEDSNCLSCSYICQNCQQCHQGICYECKLGWYLYNTQCFPIIGDSLLVGNEACDNAGIQIAKSVKYTGVSLCYHQCDDGCQTCNDGFCSLCQQGYYLEQFDNSCLSLCGDNIQTKNEECDDGIQNCLNCRLTCNPQCQLCVLGICLNCQDGWRLDAQNECKPISNDGLVVGNEKCWFNGNQPQFLEICLECSENCINCDELSQCLQCEVGYQLNYFTNQCQSICGDLIITQHEECDDGNLIVDDGCHECQFQCQDGCEHCSKGQCLKCKYGWVLNEVDFSCFTVCGDGEVGGLELCDDGNDIPLDGCYKCLYQCQLECLVCEYGKCQLCDPTLELIVATHNCQTFQSCDETNGIYLDKFDNQCKSRCGDLITAQLEECDDGNLIPYDGCDKCLFSCDPLCTDCIEGVCIKCQTGYEVLDQKCQGVCGDGIQLVGQEECDDSNLIPRDGCTACKIDPKYECILTEMGPSICYTCPKNCQICDQFECKKCKSSYFMNQGICLSCADKCEECEGTPNNCTSCVFEGCKLCESRAGQYTNLEEKSCYSKCGDNVVSEGEQCDDGNSSSNDGCDSECQLEGRFQCGDSGCIEMPLPEISIDYKNSTTTNNLFFQVSAAIKAGFCESVTVWIEQFKKNEYNVTITEETSTSQCEFVFQFYKTIEETNLIHVIVPIFDGERRLLQDDNTREIIIKPRKQVYYSESQIAQAQSVVAASENLSLILKLVGPMTILLGGFNFFWTILDILTWINNFYFINVCYPENVRMFFQQLEWGDLFMIPSIITLNSEEDDYYFEAPPKFVEKDVDPLFANNIQLFVCLVGLSFLAYLISGCLLKCINKGYSKKKQTKTVSFYNLYNNKTSTHKVILFNQQKVPFLIDKLQKECQQFNNNYRAILMQIMGLVFLDLCLASVLQLMNTSTQEFWIVKANIIIAWLNLILIGYIFYLNYKVSNSHETLLKNKSFICIFGSLYEGINIKSSICRTYSFVNLIRKSLFIFFTVYYYDDPILQTSTCCMACFLNIALLCFQNPFESVQLLIQNGLPDFCIFCILLITVGLAIDDQIKILSPETTFQIGWVILSFIGISILTQLIFLSREFYQNIKIRFIMVKNLLCPESKQ